MQASYTFLTFSYQICCISFLCWWQPLRWYPSQNSQWCYYSLVTMFVAPNVKDGNLNHIKDMQYIQSRPLNDVYYTEVWQEVFIWSTPVPGKEERHPFSMKVDHQKVVLEQTLECTQCHQCHISTQLTSCATLPPPHAGLIWSVENLSKVLPEATPKVIAD